MATYDEHTTYRNLKGQQRRIICPTNIIAMMTGAKLASQDRTGAITLTYTDNTEETRILKNAPEIESFENFFAIVRWVQDARLPA